MIASLAATAAVSCGAIGVGALKARDRLVLSMAKHPSLTGHARLARLVAARLPYYEFSEERFFDSDGAPPDIARRRSAGFARLAQHYAERYPRTRELTEQAKAGISDLQFTSTYRVPFQYARHAGRHLGSGSFLQSSSGVTVTDLDGNVFHDLAGSYGVNLLGYDFYKDCMQRGAAEVQALGPVLGAYHPAVAYNVARLREISGLDEVSFHMSGTEAVMQAVRLARYHTRRSHVVRFVGAYHGWWDDVQPGIGNPIATRNTYTLRDMSERTLRVLRRRRDIACVLVNPLQALHPNAAAPSDSALVDSSRKAGFDRAAYAGWLRTLRAVCTERSIPLIFDDVFMGFRLAPGGSAEFFGVRPDMVTYGKTVGGGFPVGVVCGKAALMRRFRAERPADICLARGTFNAHPYVMGAMAQFLRRLDTPEVRRLYDSLTEIWDARAESLNRALANEDLPVRVRNLSTVWTVTYTQPSRYNWMLQYYLRAEGLALSWVGTGRLIFSLNYTAEDFSVVLERFLAAVRAMQRDGWWWADPSFATNPIKRRIFREMLGQHYPVAARWLRGSRSRVPTG